MARKKKKNNKGILMAKESQSKLKIDLIPAEEMAKKQREISVAEFFEKNRHLLGFDNKKKALLTTIKEAVDNSLDACEEARILPELNVEIIEMSEDRFKDVMIRHRHSWHADHGYLLNGLK